MVENTSAQATAQDWRTVMLAGSISLTASLAFFNFVLPIGDWGIFPSGLMALAILLRPHRDAAADRVCRPYRLRGRMDHHNYEPDMDSNRTAMTLEAMRNGRASAWRARPIRNGTGRPPIAG